MRRLAYIALILLAGFIGYTAIQYVRESIEMGPAKRAVLEMTADLDRQPLPASQTVAPPERQPNILIILADDLGWRDVGYNQSEIRTPAIDQLAREGITLNRFYAQPSCSPTRAALLTGKSPLRLGILSPLSKLNPTGLPLSEKTLADRLGAAGYQTALVGKWHLGPRDLAYHPNARGFEHFYGNLTGGVGYYDKVHGGGFDWQRNGKTIREEGYTTRLLAKEAIRVIEDRDPERPLFLYAAFGAPHLPNEAPEETVSSYTSIENENRRLHAAMVSELDTAIGAIHATLVKEGIEDKTLIWFMSDNGGLTAGNNLFWSLPDPLLIYAVESQFGVKANETLIEFLRRNLQDGAADNRPFKGGKGSVAEGGVRVPSFLYWPGQFDPGSYNYITTVQDVTPTLLNVSGADTTKTAFDGRNLLTALKTNTPARAMDYIAVSGLLTESFAIYRYPYKLVEENGAQQLYNLETDPLETRNIADEHPDMVADLTSAIDAYPRGEKVGLPLQSILEDPDFFGGEENRPPWADQAYTAE